MGGAQAAKTEVEKILTKREQSGITCVEAVNELANIMYTIRDPSKDKPFELEMGWLCESNGWKYAPVPADMLAAAILLRKMLQQLVTLLQLKWKNRRCLGA